MTDPELQQRNAKINKILCLLVPAIFCVLTVALAAMAGTLGNASLVWLIVLAVGVPSLIGFLIALRWRAATPAVFFVIGLGLTCAVGCVVAALLFGLCMIIFANA